MKSFLIRTIYITPILIGLAFAVKVYLIEPYKMSVIDFEVGVERVMKKGDREI